MSLSTADREKLADAGFMEFEIQSFAEAKTPNGKDQPAINLGSPLWQAVIGHRKDWVENRINEGWTPLQIEGAIEEFYLTDPRRDPWYFLKIEYQPVAQKDFDKQMQLRSQRRVGAELKGYY